MPYFSIITPTYNRATLLVETIKSVLDQTFKDFELIIVDDGSTDNTKEAVQPFLSTRIKYFYQQNKRQGAARNLGIKNASGEFVAFLDHDDLWSPIFLETYYKFIQNNPHAQWIHGAFFWFNEYGYWKSKSYPVEGEVWKNLLNGNPICTSTIVVKSNLLQNIKFDESIELGISEDGEFNFRLATITPCYYQPLPLAFMRMHNTRISNTMHFKNIEKGAFTSLYKILNNPFMNNKPEYLKKRAIAHGYLFVAENAYGSGLHFKLFIATLKSFISYPPIIFTKRWLSAAIKNFIPSFIGNHIREFKFKHMVKSNHKTNSINVPLPATLKNEYNNKQNKYLNS